MKDRNKVVKMVIIITIVCVLVILGAAIGLKYTSLGEKIESKISDSNTEDTIIPGEENIPEDNPDLASNIQVDYKTEKYETKNDDGDVVCLNERNIPTVSNDAYPRGAKRIENALRSIMNDMWNNDLKRYSDDSKELGTAEKPLGVKYMANLEYQTPNVVTFSIKMEGDFGAESWNSYELYTFDVKTGFTVSLESSSAKAEEMTKDIMSLTKKAIKEKGINISLKEGESEDSVITTNMNRQGHFGILADGIHVNYQKYDLTTENDQILEVVLEANKANSFLKDEYKIK